MAIVKRVDVEGVLGVPFSSLYEIKEMDELLDQGLINIAQSTPELHQSLQVESKDLKKLVMIQEQIQSQSQNIQQLEEKLKQSEDILKKASTIYDKGSMQTIVLIGATPGPSPPLPAASGILNPLITGITLAEEQIEEIKNQIKELRAKIAQQTIQFTSDSEKVAHNVIDKVSLYRSKSYNTEEEKFISK